MPKAAPSSPLYDVVLYGASGFVGRQTVAYFAAHPQVKATGLRWALGGRSADKLEAVRKECGAKQRALWWLRRTMQWPWMLWPAMPV